MLPSQDLRRLGELLSTRSGWGEGNARWPSAPPPPPSQHILLEWFTARPQSSSSLKLLPASVSNCSWLSQALRCHSSCHQHFLKFKNKRKPASEPHACFPPPESSLLAPAVATVRSGFLGNCCHGDSALSYCVNVSRLPPYLLCDMEACKTVRLEALHLTSLPCKGGVWFAWATASWLCSPFLFSLRLPGQSLPMESPGQLRTRSALCGLNGVAQIQQHLVATDLQSHQSLHGEQSQSSQHLPPKDKSQSTS